jgi:hypothetical protein
LVGELAIGLGAGTRVAAIIVGLIVVVVVGALVAHSGIKSAGARQVGLLEVPSDSSSSTMAAERSGEGAKSGTAVSFEERDAVGVNIMSRVEVSWSLLSSSSSSSLSSSRYIPSRNDSASTPKSGGLDFRSVVALLPFTWSLASSSSRNISGTSDSALTPRTSRDFCNVVARPSISLLDIGCVVMVMEEEETFADGMAAFDGNVAAFRGSRKERNFRADSVSLAMLGGAGVPVPCIICVRPPLDGSFRFRR